MASGFVSGVTAAFRGLSTATGSAELRRLYVRLALAIFALTVVLDILGIWAVVSLTPDVDSGARAVLVVLLRVAGVAIVLLLAPLLAVLVANLVLPMLAELVFMAGMRAVDPEQARVLAEGPGMPLRRSIGHGVVRLVRFLLLGGVAALCSLIPVVGSVVGPAAVALVTASSLAWELLVPYFERRQMSMAAQHTYLNSHRSTVLGFALPYSFALAVPFVGPLLFGVAQAAAAVVVDMLDRSATPPQRARSSLGGVATNRSAF
jgi:uncharacterized protein involved in cysteine biosynthesis